MPIPQIEQLALIQSISDADAHRYIAYCQKNNMDVQWHLNRLKGWGGSEMPELVRHFNGLPHAYTHPHHIMNGKLCRVMPTASNRAMEEGTYLEPLTRSAYRQITGSAPMQELIEGIKDFSSKEHPWLRGEPDDILISGGKLVIPDYKRIANSSEFEHKSDIDYAIQLHTYALIVKEMGFDVDSVVIASLDVPPSIATPFAEMVKHGAAEEEIEDFAKWITKINSSGFRVSAKELPVDARFFSLIEKVGDMYWENMLTDNIPEIQVRDSTALGGESQKEYQAAFEELSTVKSMLDNLQDREKQLQKTVTGILSAVDDLDKKALSSPTYQLGAASILKKDVATDFLVGQDVDIRSLEDEKSRELDPYRVTMALAKAGVDITDPSLYQAKISVDKVKTQLQRTLSDMDKAAEEGLAPEYKYEDFFFTRFSVSKPRSKAGKETYKDVTPLVDSAVGDVLAAVKEVSEGRFLPEIPGQGGESNVEENRKPAPEHGIQMD